MDSPLKNPLVAGGLAMGAACFILYKFVPEDWLERLEGPSKPVLPPPIPQVSLDTLSPDKKVFVAFPKVFAGNWKEALEKQSFSWDIFPEVPKSLVPIEPVSLPKEWRLQGIYMDEKNELAVWMAVVSGNILKVGDKKGEFRVEKISKEEVIFIHPTGRQSLRY